MPKVSSSYTIVSNSTGAGAIAGTPVNTQFVDKSTVSANVSTNTGTVVVNVKGKIGAEAYGTLETLSFSANTGSVTKFAQVTSPFDFITADVADKTAGGPVVVRIKTLGDLT